MMLRFRPSALLLVLSLLAVDANTKKDNNKKLRPRIHSPHHDLMRGLQDAPIVNGTQVTDPLKYPYFGQYGTTTDRERICGGFLIAPDIVLTAAVCEESFEPTGVEFRMLTTTRGSGGITRTITQNVIHPNFGRGLANSAIWDFNVMKLSGNILVDANVPTGAQVIRMQSSRSVPEAGTDQLIIGFGVTATNAPYSDVLLEETLPSTDQICSASPIFLPDIMTCVGTIGGGTGACNGDAGGPQVDFSTVPPTAVGVASFGVPPCGTFPSVYARVSAALDWITTTACNMTSFTSELCPPKNDDCLGAVSIQVGDTAIVGDTTWATPDDGAVPSFCFGDDFPIFTTPGVWYKFIGTGAMVAAASTCDEQTDFDTVLSVYIGSCDGLTCVAGNNDTPAGCTVGAVQSSSEASFMAQAGVTYYILVRGYFESSTTGRFGLSLKEVQPPANDQCSGAISITASDAGVIGDTVSATPDNADVPSFCGLDTDNFSPGVWYKFVGTGSMVLAASTCDEITQFDTVISVYKGACGGGLTCVAANDDVLEPGGCRVGAGKFSSKASFMAEAGVTYYILVYGFLGTAGRFGLSIQEIQSPPNDVCSGAIRISPGDIGIIGDTALATPDSDAVPSLCGASSDNFSPGVWYTFTGTGFPTVAASTCDADTAFDTRVSVYQGSCNSLTCVDFAGDDGLEGGCLVGKKDLSSTVRFMAKAGVTYYILVYGLNGNQGGKFGLSLLRPPSNDECAFATPINIGDTGIIGDTTLAPPSGLSGCEANPNSPGVWYTFMGNGAMLLAASTCDKNTQFDSVISVFTTGGGVDCGELTCLDANDDINTTRYECSVGPKDSLDQPVSSEVEFMAEQGVQYYILVSGFAGRFGRFGLSVTASSPTAAPTDSMPPTPSLYIDFSYISEFSFGFDQTLVDLPSEEDVTSLLRITEVYYKRKVAESFSIPYQDVKVGDADFIQLTLEFIKSEFRDSRLFLTFDTRVTVRKRPGVPTAAQVESVLETFDSATYLSDFVQVGGSIPFSFADSVLVTVSDNNSVSHRSAAPSRSSATPSRTPTTTPSRTPTTSTPSRTPTSSTPSRTPTTMPSITPSTVPSRTPTTVPSRTTTTLTPTGISFTPTTMPSRTPTTMPSRTPSQTVASRLGYGFFAGTTVREPTTQETNGLIVQTERFYSDLFRAAFGSGFSSFAMQNIVETFDAGASLPFVLDFDAVVNFATGATNIPTTPNEVFQVMQSADYRTYIQQYVWNAEPAGESIFWDTQEVQFNARIFSTDSVLVEVSDHNS